jgi:signal peptidase I
VIGLPGDHVAIEQGRAVRDGQKLSEEYVETRIGGEDLEEVEVPEGHIYVLNDARADPGSPAMDSRRLGPIPLATTVGWFRDRASEREEDVAAPRKRRAKGER